MTPFSDLLFPIPATIETYSNMNYCKRTSTACCWWIPLWRELLSFLWGHISRAIVILAALLGLSLASVSASTESTKIGDWMASFYLSQDLSRFDEFWKHSVEKNALEADPHVRETTIGFLSQIFRKHPELLKLRIASVAQFPEKQRDAVRLVLWWADTDFSRMLLKQNGDQHLLVTAPPGIEFRSIKYTDDIDFCVGWFRATGETNALMPLITTIVGSEWAANDERPDYAVVNLRGICRRDAKMKAFVEEFMMNKDLSGNALTALLFVLDKARP